MRVAADVLASVAPGEEPPRSVREGGAEPRAVRCATAGLPALVAEELAAVGDGRVGVIVSDARHAEVAALFPGEDLEEPVVALTVTRSKGLEFDAVVVVDPAGILAQSPQGGQDLYVAVTRATRRLTVVHDGDLPEVLSRLRS